MLCGCVCVLRIAFSIVGLQSGEKHTVCVMYAIVMLVVVAKPAHKIMQIIKYFVVVVNTEFLPLRNVWLKSLKQETER